MIPSRVVVDMAMGSGDHLGIKHDRLGGTSPKRFSLQQQAVGVVDEAIQHGVGDGRITDHLVPVIDRHLARYDSRAATLNPAPTIKAACINAISNLPRI
jgi:hypothetical protein